MMILFRIFIFLLFISTPSFAGQMKEIFVHPKNNCSAVEGVEGQNVYLTTEKECNTKETGLPKMKRVEVPLGAESINIYVDGKFWKKQKLVTIKRELTKKFNKNKEEKQKALEKANTVNIEGNIYHERAKKAAKKEYNYVYSQEYKDKLAKENQRLKEELFAEQLKGTPVDPDINQDENQAGIVNLASDERIYIFWSSSVPIKTIRNYAMALDKVRDPRIIMALRGFVGGGKKIAPTMKLMEQVLLRDLECQGNPETGERCPAFQIESQIDPALFQRYNIKKVPTVVFATGVNQISGLIGEGSEGLNYLYDSGDWWSVSGDASLPYLLSYINREAKNPRIDQITSLMTGGGFYSQ